MSIRTIAEQPVTRTGGCLILVAAVAGMAAACAAGDRPRALYDPDSGRLQRLEHDVNGNGRNDAVGVMDGTQVRRQELDLDENGHVDRWDFYGAGNVLEKIGFSRQNDGVLDAYAFYTDKGALRRIEISTSRDGRFDRVELYQEGVLVRSEEDTDRDGRPDKWETYRRRPVAAPGEPQYAITSVAFDDVGRGTPQRRFVYGDSGQVTLVETDADGDGQFVAGRSGAR
jgi:hypothetical protein